jgi:hypothetical protein
LRGEDVAVAVAVDDALESWRWLGIYVSLRVAMMLTCFKNMTMSITIQRA